MQVSMWEDEEELGLVSQVKLGVAAAMTNHPPV